MAPPSQSPSRSKVIGQLAPLLSLGVELAVTVLVGGALGWFADRANSTLPLWTIVGFLLGIAAAIVHFVRTVRRLTKKDAVAPASQQSLHPPKQ